MFCHGKSSIFKTEDTVQMKGHCKDGQMYKLYKPCVRCTMYLLMTPVHDLPHTSVSFLTVYTNSMLNIIVQLDYLLKHIKLKRETQLFKGFEFNKCPLHF